MTTLSEKWRSQAALLRQKIPEQCAETAARLDACARCLESCADDYDASEKPDLFGELLSALGWAGRGEESRRVESRETIHAAIAAVRRLAAADRRDDGYGAGYDAETSAPEVKSPGEPTLIAVDIVRTCPIHGTVEEIVTFGRRKWCPVCMTDLFRREGIEEIVMTERSVRSCPDE